MKLGSLIKLVCLTLVVSIFSSTLLTGCIFLRSCTADLFSTEFNLTEADIRNYESAAESFEKSVIEGKNSLTVTLRSSMFVDGFSKIYTQYMIAYLNYCVDMKDEKALANYKFAFNAYNDANKLYRETLKNILLSDSEYADLLFETWSEEEKQMLLNSNENVFRLNEENEKLLIKYRDQDIESEDWIESVDEIYFSLVQNRNEIGKEYGYSNYYEYSSSIEYSRFYTKEERDALRGYVKKYIVPLYRDNYSKLEELSKSVDEETLEEFYLLSRGSILSSTELQGYISDYIDTFYDANDSYESYSYNMEAMFKEGRTIFANGENALDGAFTAYLMDYSEPVAYFGPSYQNMLTVAHEMGHYAAFGRYGQSASSLDLCEVHSQASEWLLISYLEDVLDPDVYELIKLHRLTNGLKIIILSAAVDECEERIYSATDADSKDDYSEIISEITSTYGEDISKKFQLEKYFRYVAPDNPVYYLSYAVSEIASMEFYTMASDDYQAAVDAYVNFVEESTDSERIKEGLMQSFDENVYKELTEIFGVDSDSDDEDNYEDSIAYVIYGGQYLTAA